MMTAEEFLEYFQKARLLSISIKCYGNSGVWHTMSALDDEADRIVNGILKCRTGNKKIKAHYIAKELQLCVGHGA